MLIWLAHSNAADVYLIITRITSTAGRNILKFPLVLVHWTEVFGSMKVWFPLYRTLWAAFGSGYYIIIIIIITSQELKWINQIILCGVWVKHTALCTWKHWDLWLKLTLYECISVRDQIRSDSPHSRAISTILLLHHLAISLPSIPIHAQLVFTVTHIV